MFGLGMFYIIGGFFIYLLNDSLIIPIIIWIQDLNIASVKKYSLLWGKVSILIGAIIIFSTIVIHSKLNKKD